MNHHDEEYKQAVKSIQKLTKHSKFIHMFCGISILLLTAKELFLNKYLEIFNVLLVAAIIWIVMFVGNKIGYKFEYLKSPFLLRGTFVIMIIVYVLAIFLLFIAVFLNAESDGSIFLLAASSAMTETPYKNETFDEQ